MYHRKDQSFTWEVNAKNTQPTYAFVGPTGSKSTHDAVCFGVSVNGQAKIAGAQWLIRKADNEL